MCISVKFVERSTHAINEDDWFMNVNNFRVDVKDWQRIIRLHVYVNRIDRLNFPMYRKKVIVFERDMTECCCNGEKNTGISRQIGRVVEKWGLKHVHKYRNIKTNRTCYGISRQIGRAIEQWGLEHVHKREKWLLVSLCGLQRQIW